MKLILSQLFLQVDLVSVLTQGQRPSHQYPSIFVRKGAFENAHLTLILAVCYHGYIGRYFCFARSESCLSRTKEPVSFGGLVTWIFYQALSIETRASRYPQTVDGYSSCTSKRISLYRANIRKFGWNKFNVFGKQSVYWMTWAALFHWRLYGHIHTLSAWTESLFGKCSFRYLSFTSCWVCWAVMQHCMSL